MSKLIRLKPTEKHFPIVGIGASAGGLKAFTQLLGAISPDIGMAFVLVQHLDPTKKSLLPKTLDRALTLPITEVKNGTKIKNNRIYVMPSTSYMTIVDSSLHLTPRSKHSDNHKPIDSFFESLAKRYHKHAIGIVLSGTGNDGTEGLSAIKTYGGITFAQDDSAQYKGMPQSAINSGNVDFILPPDAMPHILLQVSRDIKIGTNTLKSSLLEAKDINTVLTLLKQKTGRDFRLYKTTTVNRRIHRRMLLNRVNSIKEYIKFLNKNPRELEALHTDMLIHVTSFFREPEQFESLKRLVLPALLKNRSPKNPLKIWVPGCSTGEEAYSLAIILHEFLRADKPLLHFHILATDISEQAIAEAAKGVYKENITKNVSPIRLQKFFTKATEGYKVKNTIRDLCEFVVHDVTQKPLRLNFDFISCRNVLIYLGTALQQKAFFMLSSALKTGGFLLLGRSEGLGTSAKLFSVIDDKQRVYSKKAYTPTQNIIKTFKTQSAVGSPFSQTENFDQTSRQQKINKLKDAAKLTQEYANEIIDELNIMNEELQSANEELTSSNEELQTTNEEFETTQEELQTANEEMTTLNEELQNRNEEVINALDYAEGIIKTVREPLVILDSNLRVRSANESFYEMFKETPLQIENISLFEIGNKQWEIPKLRRLLEKILPKHIIITNYEVEHDFESIGQKTMLLNARALKQGPNKTPLILLAIEDITDRRDIEKQKDLFIGIASHELKTPITTMKGYSQILEKRLLLRKDSKDNYLIQNINKQTDRLTSLINDLLNTSKIQAGKLALEKKKFDLNSVITKTIVDIQYATEAHQIIKEGELKKQVFGDQSRIEQVLSNLITNAIKYSPKSDKVIVRVGTNKKNAIVSVQDFGFGIAKRDQTKIFERFYRTVHKEKMNVDGFGLGLYIAAEIIKGHKGKIWVVSKRGKSSTFYFTLPFNSK